MRRKRRKTKVEFTPKARTLKLKRKPRESPVVLEQKGSFFNR